MPIFIAALVGGLVSAAGSFVGRALLALGIGVVAYEGIDTALTGMLTMFQSYAGQLPAGMAGMLGVFKIGTGINILLSSCVVRLTLNGLTSGTMKRFVVR
jgi:hypothetical protein